MLSQSASLRCSAVVKSTCLLVKHEQTFLLPCFLGKLLKLFFLHPDPFQFYIHFIVLRYCRIPSLNFFNEVFLRDIGFVTEETIEKQ